jgi:hypothetical protein
MKIIEKPTRALLDMHFIYDEPVIEMLINGKTTFGLIHFGNRFTVEVNRYVREVFISMTGTST